MSKRRLATAVSLCFSVACGSAPVPVAQPAPPPPAALPASVAPPPVVAAPSLEGTWRGILAGQLHLVLTVTRAADGLHGSLDQGSTLPIDVLTVDGAAVHAEVRSVGGTFEGHVDSASREISGTWTQHGQSLPLVLARSDTPVEHAPPPKLLDAPVDVEVPEAPSAFRADGQTVLVYELHVTNFSGRTLTLRRVDVEARGAALTHLEGKELGDACEHVEIGPGLRSIVFMWVALGAGPVPAALEHRITVRASDEPDELTVSHVRTPVRGGAAPVIAPPLHGGTWLAGNGPGNGSGHRRALIPVGGHAQIAQRFAIDWVKVGDDGKTFHGDPKKNESYLAYGAEALSVAGGVVSEVKDGIPQNVPGSNRAVPITLETIGGNHVIVDLGGGHFAFWAHLQPGSVRVKVGDHVRRGQVLGLVGNSGNSTEPHLHFHVTDASSPLASEGVPYAFDAFELRAQGKPAVTRRGELPTLDETVAFP
jgi:murein DD-endopeptidase